jgi:hypothetical protein
MPSLTAAQATTFADQMLISQAGQRYIQVANDPTLQDAFTKVNSFIAKYTVAAAFHDALIADSRFVPPG